MGIQQDIENGNRLRNFLQDPAIQEALKDEEHAHFLEFRASKTDEERLAAWAKAKALESILARLRGKMDAGRIAEGEALKQERDAARRRR